MREFGRIFNRVFRNNVILVLGLMVLVAVTIGVCVNRRSIVYASSPVIANINCTSGVIRGDEFAETLNSSYELQNDGTTSTDFANEMMYLDANSSLCYEYTVENITENNIGVELRYNARNSVNFCASYSINGREHQSLDIEQFIVAPGEEVRVQVIISIEDISVDAMLDGSVDIVTALV